VSLVNPYGIIPNPFYQAAEAGEIRDQQDIYGTDGGFDGQGIPIWPWLQPERAIDVIFVVDAISTQSGNITNGTAIYRTYTAAQRAGLRRMPLVPTPEEVVERNLTSGAQFYGCYDEEAATVIYLPNTELGDVPRANSFTDEEVDDGFDGGLAMVTQSQSGDSEWAACVACAIVHKNVTELPDVCTGCLERYCWPRDTMSGNGTTNGTEMTNGTETTNGSGTTPSSSSAPSESTSNAGTANIVRSTCLMVVAGVVLAFFL
jgi:lysophospholipase